MDMKEATRIKEIVDRYQSFGDSVSEFEDVISGDIEDFTITTANGSITIPCRDIHSLGNHILFTVNGLFLQQLEDIENELLPIEECGKVEVQK